MTVAVKVSLPNVRPTDASFRRQNRAPGFSIIVLPNDAYASIFLRNYLVTKRHGCALIGRSTQMADFAEIAQSNFRRRLRGCREREATSHE